MTLDPEKAAISRALVAPTEDESRRELATAGQIRAARLSGEPDLFNQSVDDTADAPGWLRFPPHEQAAAFVAFHRENPHVYAELERRALKLYAQGVKRLGVKWLVECMRVDHQIATKSDEWKLNNSHTAYYARLLLHRRPELSSIIETREATAAAVARAPAP